MNKKIVATAVAVVSLLAISMAPTVASAALYSGTTKLAEGATVKGVDNEGYIYFEGGLPITCTSSTFEARLGKNGEFSSQLYTESWGFHGTGKEGMCVTPLGSVVILGNPTTCWSASATHWNLIGGQNCGRGSSTAFTVFWSEPNVECKYKIQSAMGFNATTSPVTISASEAYLTLLEPNAPICSGSYRLSFGNWSIQDQAGTPLTWK
jgi:hypothetical protein